MTIWWNEASVADYLGINPPEVRLIALRGESLWFRSYLCKAGHMIDIKSMRDFKKDTYIADSEGYISINQAAEFMDMNFEAAKKLLKSYIEFKPLKLLKTNKTILNKIQMIKKDALALAIIKNRGKR